MFIIVAGCLSYIIYVDIVKNKRATPQWSLSFQKHLPPADLQGILSDLIV